MEAIRSRPRSDTGVPRKVDPEAVHAAIQAVRPQFRDWPPANRTALYRACIEVGHLRGEQIAPNTFRRIVADFELLQPDTDERPKRRRAFCKAHINQLWQADTMVGPHLPTAGPDSRKRPARLIAFLDDASRLCVHGAFHARDDTPALLDAFRSAVYKRGVPEAVYVDNGSNYASAEVSLVCARLGVLLCHTPVRDGAAKGKIERFFRTVRADFLSRQLNLTSLEALNRQFADWVETDYHQRVHSAIGMRPLDRFGLERDRIKYLAPNQGNDETFYYSTTRRVDRANTFRLHGTRYEAPADLRERKIELRYDRAHAKNPRKPKIVYHKDRRIGIATPLDLHANDRPPRTQP